MSNILQRFFKMEYFEHSISLSLEVYKPTN
jgi:hypothetical protein